MADARLRGMYVSLQTEQVEMLREVLTHAIHELRIESARADNFAFRQMLHHREDVLESTLAKLADSGPRSM